LAHKKIINQLESYIKGELGTARQQQIKAHLAQCSSCRREYLFLKQYFKVVKKLTLAEPPADMFRRIREQTDRADGSHAEKKILLFKPYFYRIAALITFIGSGILAFYYLNQSSSLPVASEKRTPAVESAAACRTDRESNIENKKVKKVKEEKTILDRKQAASELYRRQKKDKEKTADHLAEQDLQTDDTLTDPAAPLPHSRKRQTAAESMALSGNGGALAKKVYREKQILSGSSLPPVVTEITNQTDIICISNTVVRFVLKVAHKRLDAVLSLTNKIPDYKVDKQTVKEDYYFFSFVRQN